MVPIRGSEDVPRDQVERASRSLSDAVERERLFKIPKPRQESRSLTIRRPQDIRSRFFSGSGEYAIQCGAIEAKEQIVEGSYVVVSFCHALKPRLIACEV